MQKNDFEFEILGPKPDPSFTPTPRFWVNALPFRTDVQGHQLHCYWTFPTWRLPLWIITTMPFAIYPMEIEKHGFSKKDKKKTKKRALLHHLLLMSAVLYGLILTAPVCTDVRGVIPSSVTSHAIKGSTATLEYMKMCGYHAKIRDNNVILASKLVSYWEISKLVEGFSMLVTKKRTLVHWHGRRLP